MTEDRYYVEGDCILDRLQPELCCPFPSNADAINAMREDYCEICDFVWVNRSAIDPPKRKVDIEYARNLLAELAKIDAIPLSEMQLYENGQKIEISPETIEEWRFVGLSNSAFIEMEIWKHPEELKWEELNVTTAELNDEQKFDAAAKLPRRKIELLLTEFYGERCPEFCQDCICCRKWAELDKLLENPMRQDTIAFTDTAKERQLTLIDELTSTEEGRREWQKESATVDATEAICSLMESQSKTGEWVADKLGVSKRAFTRMLSGDGNITIRQLADIFAVLGATLNITVRQQRYDAGVKWNPVAIEPESFTHALCWAKWPDGSESFRRGYFDDGRWHLDWDGSFDNDDAVVLFWLPLTEVGITHNGNGQWSLERRAAIEAEQLELACNSIFGGVGACSPEIYETLIENVAKVCGRSVDDQFREDVKNAISKLPCPLD